MILNISPLFLVNLPMCTGIIVENLDRMLYGRSNKLKSLEILFFMKIHKAA